MGGRISILLDLMLISHEVGEINFKLMYINTFLKVDLKCFTIKKRETSSIERFHHFQDALHGLQDYQ